MKILVLWTFETDYLHAALRYAESQGNSVLLVLQSPEKLLPPERKAHAYPILNEPTLSELRAKVADFKPDVAIIAGWHIRKYRQLARTLSGASLRLMATDTQWLGTLKQRLGRMAFRLHLRSLYDYAFVPGPRQQLFVARMGFSADRVVYGSIPANDEIFTPPSEPTARSGFLAVSRLTPEKGIGTLISAYEHYRKICDHPWPLRIAGIGPEPIRSVEGIAALGYLSPQMTADEMRSAGSLILASVFEPWGVVVHEAALTALPIITTDACGTSGVIAVHGRNGMVVPSNDAVILAEAMRSMSEAPQSRRDSYAQASRALGLTSTRASWLAAIEATLDADASDADASHRRALVSPSEPPS